MDTSDQQPVAPHRNFCGRTRREFLWEAGAKFTGLALTGLLSADGFFARRAVAGESPPKLVNPLAPKAPPLPAKAKSVIFLFMYGGPSHVDTFDYKPKLYELDGKTIPVKTFGRSGKKNEGRVVGPKWKFQQYGQCGKRISDLFPNLATCVDDIAFLHSMTADSPIHGSAMLQMNTGRILSGSPCLGSWVNYGLGSFNENLPGFVVMLDPTGGPISGAKNWSSGYMPATFQGTILRSAGEPILDLKPPDGMTDTMQRDLLDTLGEFNAEHLASRGDNSNLSARIASYELAYSMQRHAPEAVELVQEIGRDGGTLWAGRSENSRVRPPLPACPTARRARRAVHPALRRRRPQRRQLGRPRRSGQEPRLPRRPDRQADRRPARRTSSSAACSTRRS